MFKFKQAMLQSGHSRGRQCAGVHHSITLTVVNPKFHPERPVKHISPQPNEKVQSEYLQKWPEEQLQREHRALLLL